MISVFMRLPWHGNFKPACKPINTAIFKCDATQANIHARLENYSLKIAYS